MQALPSPTAGNALVTEQDNGRRVTVQQGKQVQVALSSCSDHYTVPTSGGPLFRSSADSRANGISGAIFQALSTGTTRITGSTDPACFHTATPCARPSALFSVDVEVVPGPPPNDSCLIGTTVQLDRSAVVATGEVGVVVRGGANADVDLFAYTRPSTTYRLVRSGVLGQDGTVSFVVRPPANTRLYSQQRGCGPSPQVVLNVATALTLEVQRLGPRQYLFSGDSLPARTGGLVVSLYRVTQDGRQVLTAQTRADASDGTWSLVRTFTGSGRFGFVARTGQDLQNAPGGTGVRSLLVF